MTQLEDLAAKVQEARAAIADHQQAQLEGWIEIRDRERAHGRPDPPPLPPQAPAPLKIDLALAEMDYLEARLQVLETAARPVP